MRRRRRSPPARPLTGHLMFSSVHAQDAVGTVMRLEDMGIERHQIASSLLMVVAQRLVRVLCKRCREATLTAGPELSEIVLTLPAVKTIYRAGWVRSLRHDRLSGAVRYLRVTRAH